MLMEQVHTKPGGSTSTVAVIVGQQLYVGHLGDSRAVLGLADKPLTNNVHHSHFDLPVRAVRISRDHKPDDPEERRRILEAGGVVIQGRVIGRDSAIDTSRALGDFDFKRPKNRARGDFVSSTPLFRSSGATLFFAPLGLGFLGSIDLFPESRACVGMAHLTEPGAPIKLTRECKFLILASDGLWNQMEERTVINTVDRMWRAGINPTAIAEKLAGPQGMDNVTVILVFFVSSQPSLLQYTVVDLLKIWDIASLPDFKYGAHVDEEVISFHESKVAP